MSTSPTGRPAAEAAPSTDLDNQARSPSSPSSRDVVDESFSTLPDATSPKRPRADTLESSADPVPSRPGPSKGTKGKAKYIPNRVKRYHERSLAGCLTCRKRRVKCDEAKPICRRCACGDRDCVYAEPSAPSASTDYPESVRSAPTAPTPSTSSQPLPGIQVSSLIHPDQPALLPPLHSAFTLGTADASTRPHPTGPVASSGHIKQRYPHCLPLPSQPPTKETRMPIITKQTGWTAHLPPPITTDTAQSGTARILSRRLLRGQIHYVSPAPSTTIIVRCPTRMSTRHPMLPRPSTSQR